MMRHATPRCAPLAVSRRLAVAFVGLAALVTLAALGPPARAAKPVLYEHGAVFTGRGPTQDATWFVVVGDAIADVGSGEVPARWQAAERVDLGGRFVAPGFVDAHVHFVDGGLSVLQADASACRDEACVGDVVRAAAAAPLGGRDGWVVVRGLGLDALGGATPTHVRMQALSALAGGRPMLVFLKGGHHAYADPRALARLGIDRATSDPEGGTIVRDEGGQPSGLLIDDAAWHAMRAVAADLGPAFIARAMLAAQREAERFGITAIGDNTFDPSHMAQFVRLIDAGLFHLRVAARSFGLEPATRFTMRAQGVRLFHGPNPQIRYFGDKYFLDGPLSQAGADPRGDGPSVTSPRYGEGELRDFMLFAGRSGPPSTPSRVRAPSDWRALERASGAVAMGRCPTSSITAAAAAAAGCRRASPPPGCA